MTDHYAATERLLDVGEQVVSEIRAVPDGADQDRRRDALGKQVMGIWAQAQVHATLATVRRGMSVGTVSVDLAPADSLGYLSIPWPPSDGLRTRCADAVWRRLRDEFGPQVSGYLTAGQYETIAAAVFDELDGDR